MTLHFEHTHREDGVHVFAFHKSTRQAVDAFIEVYEVMLFNHPEGRPVLGISDMRPDGVPHVGYAFNAVKTLYERIGQDHLPEVHLAYIVSDESAALLIRPFLDLYRVRARRTLQVGGTTDDAVAWLLSIGDDEPTPAPVDTPS